MSHPCAQDRRACGGIELMALMAPLAAVLSGYRALRGQGRPQH
jgi:hypothetical protein